jgi:hypothetical protein
MKARERNALSASVGALLEAGDERGDVPLRRGDRIVVPRRVSVVSVQGEVRAPGLVPYEPGRSFDDYVKLAGDFTSNAYKSRVRHAGIHGAASRSRWQTRGAAGDIIWVPETRRNPWGTVRDIIGVTAAVSAIVLAVVAVTK